MYGLYQHYQKKWKSARRREQQQQQQGEDIQLEGMVEMQMQKSGPLKRPERQVHSREAGLQRRKIADCQIILCLITCGLMILIAGSGMLIAAVYILGRDDPFMLIGPVFAACGLLVVLLSVEVCVRRQKVVRLAEDISSDEEDGHYFDESLIPYGFGNFSGDSGTAQPGPSTGAAAAAGPVQFLLKSLPPIIQKKTHPSDETLMISSVSSDPDG